MHNNPLVSFREKLGITPEELADEVSLAVVIIKAQELGIPHHLHPRFLKAFPDVVELIPEYQQFRTAKRRENFSPSVVPEDGAAFTEWLRTHTVGVNDFSERACMPMADIQYAIHHWRLPSTIIRFFEEINSE